MLDKEKILTAKRMAEWSGGAWQGEVPCAIDGFCIDTRLIQEGDVFVALSGAGRDGHDYLDAAAGGGAVGAIVAKGKLTTVTSPIPYLLVEDPARALADIAIHYRQVVAPKVIAITGSMGKTTVKELVAQMLEVSFRTAKTNKNWNNNIGLPLSIIAMAASTEVCVFELGMNHPDEIEPLCKIADPVCGVVTNVGPVHIEFFDSVKDIAIEKAALLKKLPDDGIAFLNKDDEFFELLKDSATCRVVTVSMNADADYCCLGRDLEKSTITVSEKETGDEIVLPMPLPGDFNVLNVLFAIGVARWMDIDWAGIADALENYQAMPMRWSMSSINEIKFINDAYNANPISMRAAVETFYNEHQSKSRWLVLGGMLELGAGECEEHKALGGFIASMPWDGLIVVGELGAHIANGAEKSGLSGDCVYRCDDNVSATELIKQHVKSGSVVLLKGSRGFKLEQIIDYLLSDKAV
ncbi:MAG: UDP-N-acetylmuramoyl-tripeptide--D-alanyl-D-alanine ligase [Kiritimatiellae bacterium]|nr:UDP-N-acetylmuramoyl-tripeptide--D-alanyl-D-alanine ligase [Kiritimatiellia bacterium]